MLIDDQAAQVFRIRPVLISAHVEAIAKWPWISFKVEFRSSIQCAGVDAGRTKSQVKVSVFRIKEEWVSVDITFPGPASSNVRVGDNRFS